MSYIEQGETWATTRGKINQVIKVSYTELLADTLLTYSGGAAGSVVAGDYFATTDGQWYEVADSAAVDHHVTTTGGVKLYEAGPNFSTRARAVAAHARNVAASRTIPDGTVWTAGGVSYERDSTATAISDLSGWTWVGLRTPQHFGAIGDGTTDDTTAFSAFFQSIQSEARFGLITAPNVVEDGAVAGRIPPGRYLCTGSVNATNIRGVGWTVYADGATIHSQATGKAALDALGSRWGTVKGLKITGDATSKPRTGFQYGRTTTASYSCDGMVFERCKTDGYFSLSAVYSLASETQSHKDPIYINNDSGANSYCMVFDGNNFFGATSDFIDPGDILSGVTAMSNIQHTVIGGELRKLTSGPVVWASKANQLKFINGYVVSKDDAAFVLADDGNGFNDIELDVHFETSGMTNCVRFEKQATSGAAYCQVRGFRFRDHAPFAGTNIFDIDTDLDRVILHDADIHISRLGATPSGAMTNSPSKLYVIGQCYAPNGLFEAFQLHGRMMTDSLSSVSSFPAGRYSVADQNGNEAWRGDFLPYADDTYDLGSSTLRYTDGWINRLRANEQTVADDAVYSETPPASTGLVVVFANAAAAGLLAFSTGGTLNELTTSGQLDVTTGVLSGTTGTDGRLTVSVSGGSIYVENRLGASVNVRFAYVL